MKTKIKDAKRNFKAARLKLSHSISRKSDLRKMYFRKDSKESEKDSI
jgi:hypothetical protein